MCVFITYLICNKKSRATSLPIMYVFITYYVCILIKKLKETKGSNKIALPGFEPGFQAPEAR